MTSKYLNGIRDPILADEIIAILPFLATNAGGIAFLTACFDYVEILTNSNNVQTKLLKNFAN